MKKFLIAGAMATALTLTSMTADAARYFTQGTAQGSKTPYGDNVKIGRYVQASDARIYYEVYGKGTPILILHGGGVGTPYELGKILDELKKNHTLRTRSFRNWSQPIDFRAKS